MFARRWRLSAAFAVALVLVTAACSNSGSTDNIHNPPPPPAQAIAIAFQSTPPTGVTVGSSASFTAVVTNDNTNGGAGSGVDWNITCASGSCGSLSAPHTASGQAVTYTPPSTLPGNSEVVNIAGFATADHTQSVLASITVTAFGSNLMGTYVLQAQGAELGVPFQMVAVVVLDGNGNVTSGEQTIDYLDPNGGNTSAFGAIVPSGSSYFLGPDGRGTITLNGGNTNDAGPQVFSLAYLSNAHLVVAAQPSNSNALVVSASGTMDLQTSSGFSPLSGGYAFAMGGTDLNGIGFVGMGGVLNVDNLPGNSNNISGAGSIADEVYGGTMVPLIPVNGTVSAPDQFGVVQLLINFSSPSLTQSINVTGYIVDGTTIRLIESDQAVSGSVAGVALAQGSSTGSFLSPASFSGTYVFDLLGVDFAVNAPDTFTSAGILTADGASHLSSGYSDSAFQSLISPVTGLGSEISGSFTGSYNSGPTGVGRYATFLAFSNPKSYFPTQINFYLSGPNSPAVVLGYGNPSATYPFPFVAVGLAYPQSTGPLNFAGSYGLYFSQQNGSEFDGTGLMNVAAPSLSAVVDVGSNIDQGFTGTFSSTSCSSVVSGCFPASFSNVAGSTGLQGLEVANQSVAFSGDIYMIDSTQGFFVENDLLQQSTPQVSLGYFSAATLPQQSASAAKKTRHR